MKALSKANQAQIKSKEATRKVEQAKKELEDIAAILATVQEPGAYLIIMALTCHNFMLNGLMAWFTTSERLVNKG